MQVLNGERDMEVVHAAPNGRIAVRRVEQNPYDVVVLDVEMPDMNGLEALKHIRRHRPKLPVIMFSSLTVRGGAVTLDALQAGATDCVAKPSNQKDFNAAMNAVRESLVPKIRGICRPKMIRRPIIAKKKAEQKQKRIDAVVIGVSTGGPTALEKVVPSFPKNCSVPIFIVQHMPPTFTRLLAERLDRICPLKVTEAVNGETVQPGRVYVAPGGLHMEVRGRVRQRIALTEKPPENSCRPAVDVLFRTASEIWGDNLLAVVLTGMGADGAKGAQIIAKAGGQVVIQDQMTSVVWGMPGAVYQTGVADRVLPIQDVGPFISGRVLGPVSA